MKVQVPGHLAARLIVSGPVGLVTSAYRGRFDVTTISWMAPVSRDPVLVAIAVNPSTLCHDLIKRGGEYVINIPSRDVLNQVVTCGIDSGNNIDKFQTTGLAMVESQVVRPPSIEQCIGHLECAVVNAFQPGDHTLFIGQVAYALAEQAAFEETWRLEEADLKPLNHLGGFWFATLQERIDATPPRFRSGE